MSYSTANIWLIIVLLGIFTFLIRFSFIGIIGSRPVPDWLLRHLRYTSVAVFPGLVAPLVLWPQATDGNPDPARLFAAAVTIAAGLLTKNLIASILSGGAALYLGLYLFN